MVFDMLEPFKLKTTFRNNIWSLHCVIHESPLPVRGEGQCEGWSCFDVAPCVVENEVSGVVEEEA